MTVLGVAYGASVAFCGWALSRENRKLPRYRRAGTLGILGRACVWIPVLAYCTVAVGIDALRARWR